MHDVFIRRCLTLAEKGRGKTGINPIVGAVLVREREIIAEGFHEEFGKPHAERMLLQNYEQKIRSTDTLYVNLEPCCHTHKKTPPCTEMLIERGIKNVVIGMIDPNPKVAGKGIGLLRSHGVTVTVASGMTADCLRLNRGFVSLMTKGRPWITLKSARTMDGQIANADGSPRRITSKDQDAWSHRMLRAKHDAILVGIGTVLKDDPQLTIRFPSPACLEFVEWGEGIEGRGLWRIILDPNLKTPESARVVRHGTIVVASSPDLKKANELEKKGVRVLNVPMKKGVFDWDFLWKILMTPVDDFHGISSILVEGGPKTWEVFRQSHLVDEEVQLIG